MKDYLLSCPFRKQPLGFTRVDREQSTCSHLPLQTHALKRPKELCSHGKSIRTYDVRIPKLVDVAVIV